MSEGLHNGADDEDGGVPFYVNKGGLPIDEPTWERMWGYVARTHPDGENLVRLIRSAVDLPRLPIPAVPALTSGASVPERVEAVQRYIRELQYNHTGTQFFEIKKTRPLTGLMDLAKEMTKEALPIKCLEAVILGLYLTNHISGLERFPVSFKTQFGGGCFRHIVLALHWGGHYGAIGISRREDLMYKPLQHRTLNDLMVDFQDAYARCWHMLKKIKIGPYVSHDPHSVEQIDWKHSVLDVQELGAEGLRRELERHSREMRLRIIKGPPSPPKERRREVTPSPQRGQASPQRRERPERRPSGEKPVDPKTLPDLSSYQIRV
ncbi:tubulinyl-Tyr carboxypeptidase 1 isoform X3 [Phyllobates terribilis]|uniref:tubulinyl-Tyr carboxypeptidase 1 isoform X3 n=1 Tax=Phyllobates terribilis TaxID=111132 RepID=UPI003CCB0C1E